MSHQLLTTTHTTTLDRHYYQNVFGISAVEFCWGLGLPVVVESTFLQLFLKNMGASSLGIGLIPFFFFIGMSLFAVISSYMTEHMALKRAAVIWLHIATGLLMFIIGSGLFLMGQSTRFLLLFFSCYAFFSILIGMTLPVWLNYLVKIFSEKRSVAALAIMLIAQNLAKLIASIYIVHFVDRFAFSPNHSAAIFIGVGLLFSLGALFFFFTKELPQPRGLQERSRPGLIRYVGQSMAIVWKNKNFMTFLAGDVDLYVIITVISFYANYATDYWSISPALAAGAFVGAIYIGAIVANVLLGPMGMFSLKGKYLFEKMAAMTALMMLLFSGSNFSFLLASFFLGVARGTRMLVFPPAVKKLSRKEDATAYFAVAPIFTLPISALLPLACGRFLDSYQYLGALSYRLVFFMALMIILCAFIFILKTNFLIQSRTNDIPDES